MTAVGLQRARWASDACLAVVLVLLASLQLSSLRLLSATHDEANHLASGYSYVATSDYRMNPQHPPAFKLMVGAALLPFAPRLDLGDPAWNQRDAWGFGRSFLYRNGNDADLLLAAGRLPAVFLSVLLVVYVWRWAGDRHGPAGAALAATLTALCPTLVAHGQLVTFDAPLACFSTASLYHLWRRVRGGSRLHLVLAGLALGLALGTKFSGLVLVPVFVVLLAASALERGGRPSRAAADLGVVLVLAAVVVQTAYGSLDLTAYARGAALTNRDHASAYPYFMAGNFQTGGFASYFRVAFLVKTPLPSLALIALACVLFARHRGNRLDEAFVVLPAAAWFLVTSALADDIGVRYLMPFFPLAYVFAARCAPLLFANGLRRLVVAALGAWLVAASLSTWPDHLAYFNEAVGGPAKGHLWLDDSNIDWSQNVKRLAGWVRQHGRGPIKVRLSPTTAPSYYGLDWSPATDEDWAHDPSPGLYAMSTHLLIRGEYMARTRGYKTDWLSRYRPIGRIGYSIYLFRFADRSAPAPATRPGRPPLAMVSPRRSPDPRRTSR